MHCLTNSYHLTWLLNIESGTTDSVAIRVETTTQTYDMRVAEAVADTFEIFDATNGKVKMSFEPSSVSVSNNQPFLVGGAMRYNHVAFFNSGGSVSSAPGLLILRSNQASNSTVTIGAGLPGQIMHIAAVQISGAGNYIVEPTDMIGTNTKITFSSTNDSSIIIWAEDGQAGGWQVLSLRGASMS